MCGAQCTVHSVLRSVLRSQQRLTTCQQGGRGGGASGLQDNVFCLSLIKHQAIKRWENGGVAPCILNLGTSFRYVATLTPELFTLKASVPAPSIHLEMDVSAKGMQ
jgi:hypothetical protein